MKSGPGSPNYVRLRDRGQLRQCSTCGRTRRTTSSVCWAWEPGIPHVCRGDLVINEVRNAIELAQEKLEITKHKLRKADKALKDAENPLYKHPRGKEAVFESRLKKRNKLRKQLTAMGYDWTKLEE